MGNASRVIGTLLIFICSLGVVVGGLYYYMHKDDHLQAQRPNELAPMRTCRGIESSTLFGHSEWKKYANPKGYCSYVSPELGCLISLQLAPNGRVTIFRINALAPEPNALQHAEILWFACDFIYGNEACAYKPILDEFIQEIVQRFVIANNNAFAVMDTQVGLFQSASGELSGIECRTKYARPWHGATAINKYIKEINRDLSKNRKLSLPPSVVPSRIVIFAQKPSPSKELNDSEKAIYQKFVGALAKGNTEGCRIAMAQMEALGRTARVEEMTQFYDYAHSLFPKYFKD